MNKTKLPILLVFVLAFLLIMNSAFAQENSKTPAIQISDVVEDDTVTVIANDFPADTDYIVKMNDVNDQETMVSIARFNTADGGSFAFSVSIPEELKGVKNLTVVLEDQKGNTVSNTFVNGKPEAAATAAVATEVPATAPTATTIPTEKPTVAPTEESTAVATEEPTAVPTEVPAVVSTKTEVPVTTEAAPTEDKSITIKEPASTEVPAASSTDVPVEVSASPTIKVNSINPGKSVNITVNGFPVNVILSIRMGAYYDYSTVAEAMTYDVKEQAPFTVDVPIPENAAGIDMLFIEISSSDGSYAYDWFYNTANGKPASESLIPTAMPYTAPVTTSDTTMPVSAEYCDFSIIPSFTINSVKQNEEVTMTFTNLPANTSFTVRMGNFVSYTYAQPEKPCYPWNCYNGMNNTSSYPYYPTTCERCPEPKTKNTYTTVSGLEVGSIDTANGSTQTLTFAIPAALKGMGQIAVLISDTGSCGFYAYNYFWNNSTN